MNIPHPDKFNELKKWSAFKIFLVGTIFAPILEEVTFRLPLIYSKIYISMLFGVLTEVSRKHHVFFAIHSSNTMV